MLLVLDNHSAFSQDLISLVGSLTSDFEAASYDAGADLGRFDSVIISGRKRNNPDTNAPNMAIIRHCISEKKPLLGICYGAEILALSLGGTLRRAPRLAGGMHRVRTVRSNPILDGEMEAFGNNHFEIARLPDALSRIAGSDAHRYEAVQYRDMSVFGVQFHPECSPDGREAVARFLDL